MAERVVLWETRGRRCLARGPITSESEGSKSPTTLSRPNSGNGSPTDILIEIGAVVAHRDEGPSSTTSAVLESELSGERGTACRAVFLSVCHRHSVRCNPVQISRQWLGLHCADGDDSHSLSPP